MTLLVLCYFLVHFIWKLRHNPDNYCIPLLTAIGDFLGVGLLFLAFYGAYICGNKSLKPHTIETTTYENFNSTLSDFQI